MREVRQLGSYRKLPELLQHIASAAVEVLGFAVAVVNLAEGDGDLRAVAVEGPPDIQELRGQVGSRAAFEKLLDRCQTWGSLRFLDHRDDDGTFDELPSWVPEGPAEEVPGRWHPGDALLAPMYSSRGDLLGVLSVDLPIGGAVPSAVQRVMLELFAAEGANAIEEGILRAALSDSEATYRSVFEMMSVGVAVTDDRLRLIDANQAFASLAGGPAERLVGRMLGELMDEADAAPLIAACTRLLDEQGTPPGVDHRLRGLDGTTRWVRSRLSVVRGTTAGDRLIVQSEDVTDQRRALAELEQLAHHDPLTGLPNRRSALVRIDQAVGRRRPGEMVCVMFCDLDGFKAVNDTFGHVAGDQVLAVVAERLMAALRTDDLLFRLGGDEFVVLCEHVHSVEAANAIAERLVAALDEAGRADREAVDRGAASRADSAASRAGGKASRAVEVSMSVGLAFADDAHADPSALELISAADHALYRAKREGRGRFAHSPCSSGSRGSLSSLGTSGSLGSSGSLGPATPEAPSSEAPSS